MCIIVFLKMCRLQHVQHWRRPEVSESVIENSYWLTDRWSEYILIMALNITQVRRSEQSSNRSVNSCCCQNDSIISTFAAEINIYHTDRNIWSVQSLNTKHVSFGVGWCGSWKPLSHVPALFPSSIHRCPSDISSSSLVWQCVCHWCAWYGQTCIHYRGQQQVWDYVRVWETYTIFLLGN